MIIILSVSLFVLFCILILTISFYVNKIHTLSLYQKFSQESILHYKNWLYDVVLENDNIELYKNIQEYSEKRRKEFLDILESK